MDRKTSLSGFINWIFLASTIIVISCGKVPTQNDIYGVWKSEHFDKEFMFEFNSDGTCVINIKNTVSDSIEILNGNFTIDFSKKPIPLSIRNIPQLNHPLHAIVEFLGGDSIRLGNFAPRWRVRNISFEQNKSIILKRNKLK